MDQPVLPFHFSAPAGTALGASPLRLGHSSWAEFRTEQLLAQERHREQADSNRNMAIHMEVQDFISTFLPNATKPAAGKSALKKPPLMSTKIAGKILAAAANHNESEISEIWVRG